MILEWKLPKDFIQYLLGFQIKPNCTNKEREKKLPWKFQEYAVVLLSK